MIAFDRSDASHPSGIQEYQIFAHRQGAAFPIVDQLVADSEFLWESCGYVINQSLDNWEWRVRLRDDGGHHAEARPGRVPQSGNAPPPGRPQLD